MSPGREQSRKRMTFGLCKSINFQYVSRRAVVQKKKKEIHKIAFIEVLAEAGRSIGIPGSFAGGLTRSAGIRATRHRLEIQKRKNSEKKSCVREIWWFVVSFLNRSNDFERNIFTVLLGKRIFSSY